VCCLSICLSVRLFVRALNLKTKKHRKLKVRVNIPNGRLICQFLVEKVKRSGLHDCKRRHTIGNYWVDILLLVLMVFHVAGDCRY